MAWYDVGDLLMKVPLEDLAARLGLRMERRNHQVSALCPFHQDTRPSLSFYPAAKGSLPHFHCFACGAHGNAVDLVKELNGSDFKGSVEWLARLYDVQPVRGKPEAAYSRSNRVSALDFAIRQFNLHHDVGRFERWCSDRGFDTAFLYGKGLRCIPQAVLVTAADKLGVGERLELLDGLLGLGLVRRLRTLGGIDQHKLDYGDQFSDYFDDGRIIIPVYEAGKGSSRAVGFAGRLLDDVAAGDVPKYRLTPGFKKSDYLFNADSAFSAVTDELKEDRPSKLYIVEGFLDALRLESLGQHAIGLMGTSLSKDQFRLLSDFVETRPDNAQPLRICAFLDNDVAGFRGAERLVRDLLGMVGVDLQWMGVPWKTRPSIGKDPDACLRDISGDEHADAWLAEYSLPAEAALLISSLGGKDSSVLADDNWKILPAAVKERALFRAAVAINRSRGKRQHSSFFARLAYVESIWADELGQVLAEDDSALARISAAIYLNGEFERTALARTLAYCGSRRGELPCDEEAWITLGANARLFDTVALDRLKSVTAEGSSWRQAAPFDAVNLPRKLSSEESALNDPRLKVMPHPADLHVQQIFLNELLTERHDRISAGGRTFSSSIPAVRWYSSRDEVIVTGPFSALNEPDRQAGEPATLSFGYQIDMEVLEGHKTPSDQGMFRPFSQCWRDFMQCLGGQCRSIGSQVHVLRLDVRRYYDTVQRFVVRDRLLAPLIEEINASGLPAGFSDILGLNEEQGSDEWAASLERLLMGFQFGYAYRNPEQDGLDSRGEETVGIPQGPVISAYIGTIALFPVDNCARKFIRESSRVSESGQTLPRAGYARYVDDIVIFAESAQLLGDLREALQAEARLSSVALIHKGDRVRAGSPQEVMRQLNEGRGLAASVPGLEAPLVGDGEAGWGLARDALNVNRQCALRMLRHPDLVANPPAILPQVRAAMAAKDLRPNDLGLCARWLWWLVACETNGLAERPSSEIWSKFWATWDRAYDERQRTKDGGDWYPAFKERGYHWLYAIEGLDRLLDPNPWVENGQTIEEIPQSRARRQSLAQAVCRTDFFRDLAAKENQSHLRRRAWLIVAKARRLSRNSSCGQSVSIHHAGAVTSVEWLCLAAEALYSIPHSGELADWEPLNELRNRENSRSYGDDGLRLADAVRDLLKNKVNRPEDEPRDDVVRGLAIDFVLNSAPGCKGLEILIGFDNLFKVPGAGDIELIAHLPVSDGASSLYALESTSTSQGKRVYVYTAPRTTTRSRTFIGAALGEEQLTPEFSTLKFSPEESEATRLGVERSEDVVPWALAGPELVKSLGSTTRAAARLFDGLYAIHLDVSRGEEAAYVPFMPQLVHQERDDQVLIHLLGEPMKRESLGVNAWFHDWDGRVRTTSVPMAHADIWRVGWTVADLLGVAADMSGETGNREETLAEEALSVESSGERRKQAHAELIEGYVLRQQLRKLQGAYLSEAQVDISTAGLGERTLPRTVRRALDLLRNYPADEDLRTRTWYVLLMEAHTRAMAARLRPGGAAGLRNTLHLVFPEAIGRLPLWLLQGVDLRLAGSVGREIRPELLLLQALYGAMQEMPQGSESGQGIDGVPMLRLALALAVATAGLRGCVAAMWGLTQGNENRLKDSLSLPTTWVLPDEQRADPQGDYRAICTWLTDANGEALERATPWHWMLVLVGLLDSTFPRALEIPELSRAFSVISAWRYGDAGSESADVHYEANVWPFDDLPALSLSDCDELVRAIADAAVRVDALLGLCVVPVEAPSFRRDAHTDEFTDAKDVGWQLSKAQYTCLGGGGVERVLIGTRRLSAWTETRRKEDGELVAVHWLGGKLGKWLGLHEKRAPVSPVQRPDLLSGQATAPDERPPLAVQDHGLLMRGGGIVAPESEMATHRLDRDQGAVANADVGASADGGRAPDQEGNASVSTDEFFARLREIQAGSFAIRRRSGADGPEAKSCHFRVALLQLSAPDSYCHPVVEVGIDGLPLTGGTCDDLQSVLKNDRFNDVRTAGLRGDEHHWKQSVNVISWPEHRRRAVLREALNASHKLGVELLVLPEVSLRKETIEWMKAELTKHYPGLSVLAGTYRNFSSGSGSEHLKEMLTLLWRPEKSLLDKFGLKSEKVIELSRGKKYRSVAAHELFNPDAATLAPLYSDERVLDELLRLKTEETWSSDQIRSLVSAFASSSPKLRYCMELICSELFLLTSPANREPLVQELERILTLFGQPDAGKVARTLVEDDLQAVGELLTLVQRRRERRSVLLVPAHTTRSNDYWHAGQASVLASGTATVFCNAVLDGASGESCFIGIESVTRSPSPAGVVKLLTPYHGWHTGILQSNGEGALSNKDQALVVVDIDPVHVVSGKPRPQLLPEPMALVAYMPVVEVVDQSEHCKGLAVALAHADKPHGMTPEEEATWLEKAAGKVKESERLLTQPGSFKSGGAPHPKSKFQKKYQKLEEIKSKKTEKADYVRMLEDFSKLFGNSEAICRRFDAWSRNRHQQPSVRMLDNSNEPAWVDFLVADLTCYGSLPELHVPAWSDPDTGGEC